MFVGDGIDIKSDRGTSGTYIDVGCIGFVNIRGVCFAIIETFRGRNTLNIDNMNVGDEFKLTLATPDTYPSTIKSLDKLYKFKDRLCMGS